MELQPPDYAITFFDQDGNKRQITKDPLNAFDGYMIPDRSWLVVDLTTLESEQHRSKLRIQNAQKAAEKLKTCGMNREAEAVLEMIRSYRQSRAVNRTLWKDNCELRRSAVLD